MWGTCWAPHVHRVSRGPLAPVVRFLLNRKCAQLTTSAARGGPFGREGDSRLLVSVRSIVGAGGGKSNFDKFNMFTQLLPCKRAQTQKEHRNLGGGHGEPASCPVSCSQVFTVRVPRELPHLTPRTSPLHSCNASSVGPQGKHGNQTLPHQGCCPPPAGSALTTGGMKCNRICGPRAHAPPGTPCLFRTSQSGRARCQDNRFPYRIMRF